MQNLRGKQSALWGFENSQWERGVYAPVAPRPHYSPLRSNGIFWASHKREFWSRKYPLRTCLHQKDRTLIKRVLLLRVFYPSLQQNLLSLFDSRHQALVEAFQNVDHVVLKWKHRIVFISSLCQALRK